jgi:hypothetical protein
MTNLVRKIEIFVIVVIVAFIGIVFAFKKPAVAPTNQNTNSQQQVPANIIQYQGQNGQIALALLQASHRVEVKHYSFGDLVVSIDGLQPDSKHFWAFYVNGQFSQVGASAYVTKSTDTIRWQIDTVDNTK